MIYTVHQNKWSNGPVGLGSDALNTVGHQDYQNSHDGTEKYDILIFHEYSLYAVP